MFKNVSKNHLKILKHSCFFFDFENWSPRMKDGTIKGLASAREAAQSNNISKKAKGCSMLLFLNQAVNIAEKGVNIA